MDDITLRYLLIYFGLLCGGIYRTLWPYWQKMTAGEIDCFDRKFYVTFVGNFMMLLVVSLMALPSVNVDAVSPLTLFISAFSIGFTSNHVLNNGVPGVKTNTVEKTP